MEFGNGIKAAWVGIELTGRFPDLERNWRNLPGKKWATYRAGAVVSGWLRMRDELV